MKNLLITLVVVILSVSNVFAQLDVYGRYTVDGKTEFDINYFGVKKLTDKINLTYFALVEKSWSEALIGFAYSPTKWLEVGLSSGIEHNPSVCRFGGSLWLGKGNTSFLVLLEQGHGSDNYWYKINLSNKLSETVSLGLMAWRFQGIGPILRFSPKKSDLSFWMLPCIDTEFGNAKRLNIGITMKM